MQQVVSKEGISIGEWNGATTNPVAAISQTAARLTIAGAVMFLVLLAALHIIKSEFDPSWRFISEYAIGNYGWVMKLAFFSLAFSCASLFIAIRSQTGTTGGKIGFALLLISAIALIMGLVIRPAIGSMDSSPDMDRSGVNEPDNGRYALAE